MLSIQLSLVAFILFPSFCYAQYYYDDDSSSKSCGCDKISKGCVPEVPGKPYTLTVYQGPGPVGPAGPAGPKGDQGAKGPPGTPRNMNWKQCVFNGLSEPKDLGLIKSCTFRKLSSKTSLRVYWSGGLRIKKCSNCCKRWYFTFNGNECSTPDPIDGLVYMLSGATLNPFRVRHIEGVCNALPAGIVEVGFHVGYCRDYSYNADAHSGWNSVSRIYVEEIPPPQQ